MRIAGKLTFKRFLIGLLILPVLVILSVILYYFYYLNFSEKLTFKVTDNIIVINDIMTSMYIVKGDNGYIAVDTGMDESIIEKGLELHGLKKTDIKVIFLTHSDFDHVMLLDLFPKADIYISEAEYRMVDSGVTRFNWLPFYKNSLPERKYNLLKDGDEIDTAGLKIKCILIPGHTEGSMAYLYNEEYLFSGDAFRLKNGKISLPIKKQYVMNSDMQSESINKLAAYKKIKLILTANSGISADINYALAE